MKTSLKNTPISNFSYPNEKYYRYICLLLLMLQTLNGCKKFVAVDPPDTSVSAKLIFTNLAMAEAAVNGIYSRMAQTSGGFVSGSNSITTLFGLSSDEFINQSATDILQIEFYQNQVNSGNAKLSADWSEIYNFIYAANSVIEGLKNSSLPASTGKNQLQGEAFFIRAYCHFYLTGLFGAVPYITGTDYRINQTVTKSSTENLYVNMVADLVVAKSLLDANYLNNQRIRANQAAANALLARIYLYQKDWKNAEAEASQVITNPLYQLEENLNQTFLIDSKEAILQMQSVVPRISTFDGLNYLFSSQPTNLSLNPKIFEDLPDQDQRKQHWIGTIKIENTTYYYPNKYKLKLLPVGAVPSEYLNLLRLSEQYLIRSEARAQQNKFTLSCQDLNKVRKRAGLQEFHSDNQQDVLVAIAAENRIEFLAEWGHRWLDLKRTGKIDAVLSTSKPNWKSSASIFPVPQSEILKNPALSNP